MSSGIGFVDESRKHFKDFLPWGINEGKSVLVCFKFKNNSLEKIFKNQGWVLFESDENDGDQGGALPASLDLVIHSYICYNL